MSFFASRFGPPVAETSEQAVDDDEYQQFVAQQLIEETSRLADDVVAAEDEQHSGKRARGATNSTARQATGQRKLLPPAVPPPLMEFDTKTLGGRELDADRGWLRVTFENAKAVGEVFTRLRLMHEILPLCFTQDGIVIRFIDSAHIVFVSIAMPRSAAIVYDNVFASETTVFVHAVAFQERKAQLNNARNTITFGFQDVASDANTLFVSLYPRTGVKQDGFVHRFTVPTIDDDIEEYEDMQFDDRYQHEVTIGYSALLEVIANFKTCEKIVFALTDESLDVAGRSDDRTTQSTQIAFLKAVEVVSDEASAIEAALRGRACAHYKQLQPTSPKFPAKIINFQISYSVIKRTMMMFAGCRFVRLRLGRGYTDHDGCFLPLGVYGTYYSDVDNRVTCTVAAYISPIVEADN